MQDYEKQFLFLLRKHINDENLPDGYHFDVSRVFSLAMIHNIVPMIYDAALGSAEDVSRYKNTVVRSCGMQIMKNAAFNELYDNLNRENIEIVVLKGPVCTCCYNKPDLRLSSDFDIVVSSKQKTALHEYLLDHGYICKNDTYSNDKVNLYLEVSTALGEGAGTLKSAADAVFVGFENRLTEIGGYRTLEYTDNLVYIIYHAFKHFVGSGFGIRQLIDIMLFAEKNIDKIDFIRALKMLADIGALNFTYNVFNAVQEIFGADFSIIMKNADSSVLCYDGFIADLLLAGVFGKSSEDRLHSAALVASAVEKNGKTSFMQTVFPSYSVMRNKYAVLKLLPFLLPIFWLIRLLGYVFKSVGRHKKVSPSKSIEIAAGRIELMKKMGIIEQ